MINFKQMDLSKVLFEKLKSEFPELELESITESSENPDHVWVNIVMPENEHREIEIRESASKISTDMLLKYGYHITIGSASGLEKNSA